MKSAPAVAVHRLSLYNPSRLTDAEIIASFAARRPLFDRILNDIKAEKPRGRPQHHLIVGQRGMGKSTLLARLAAELRSDELTAHWIPLVFAEEQYAVDRLSKFWLNCLDSLADACERARDEAAMDRIDATVQRLQGALNIPSQNEEHAASEALSAFLETAKNIGKRPVLLVDNLQLVFERLTTQQQHTLREVLMRPGCPLLVGASPSPPPENHDYGAAFYDHFKTHYLRPLDVKEMRELMLALAEAAERPDVRTRVTQNPARLTVLRQLTGGNPRTTVTLFFLYAEDFAPSVFADLENLLDRVTPLYKARFEELTPQQQVIASAVANHWDPVTGAVLANATGLPASTISSQLDRLERTGFVEKVDLFGESRTGFQIAERFFNVWFLMRSASRRQRREVEFLTRFIESNYEPSERPRIARHLMEERDLSADRHLFSRALAATLSATDAKDLERHAELDALRQKAAEARRRLEEVIDFSALEPATLEFDQLRERLMALVPAECEISPEYFATQVLGDRGMFQRGAREQLATGNTVLSGEKLKAILESIEKQRLADGALFGKEAVLWFSHRLATGQLRSKDDLGDWTRTFEQANDPRTIQLVVESIPGRIGSRLTGHVVAQIRDALQPPVDADAVRWYNWGYDLHYSMRRYEEAENAYRESMARPPLIAEPWNEWGNLLQLYSERYEESERAYRKAIAVDPNFAPPWNNLGSLLQNHLARYEESEKAYREALERNPNFAQPWNGLGKLLQERLARYEESEQAYRESITRDPEYAPALNGLGNLLQEHLARYEEAERAYREAIARDPDYAHPWNGLGCLLHDYLARFEEAEKCYLEALRLIPGYEDVIQNLVSLRRDFMGDVTGVAPLLEELSKRASLKMPDVYELQEGISACYAANWGEACVHFDKALERIGDGFPPRATSDWMRASAVLLHLNYGEEFLSYLEQRGDNARLRPWFEALKAFHLGDRRHLQNIAPEVRTAAEKFYDEIECRLKNLPEKTRRRPRKAEGKKATRRGKRSMAGNAN